jgi:hypothetical protein
LPQKPRVRRGAKIDWHAALEHFLELGPERRFSTVALRFGVSDTAVRRHAHREGWRDQADEFDRAVAAEARARNLRSRTDRVVDTLLLIDGARTALLDRLEDGSLEIELQHLGALLRHESLLDGEATDRVDFAEVQAALRAFTGIALRYVPDEQHDPFLAEIEHLTRPKT